MKPLTASEVRAEVSRLPAEYRDNALRLLASAYDGGITHGLANLPRSLNPFLVAPVVAQGKRKR